MKEWRVEFSAAGARPAAGGSAEVRAIWEPASAGAGAGVFVFAHGAGGHRDDRGMLALAPLLRARGLDVVRFNFPYREQGSARPDPMPRLTACIAAVAARAGAELGAERPLILGGRSMGGRAASMLVADGFACSALLLLAYPLHPAGAPEKLRDAHLPRIALPVLCLNGTRDALCERARMDAVVGRLGPTWTQHWLEGADHGFRVLERSGRSEAELLGEIGEAVGGWIAGWRGARWRGAR